MIVGAAAVEIEIHGSHSLKEKRGVVQSICRRVRNRFNLAVAEVGHQDVWQRSVLGLAAELRLRRMPSLSFRHDPSLALGARTLALLHEIEDEPKDS